MRAGAAQPNPDDVVGNRNKFDIAAIALYSRSRILDNLFDYRALFRIVIHSKPSEKDWSKRCLQAMVAMQPSRMLATAIYVPSIAGRYVTACKQRHHVPAANLATAS